MVYKTTSYMSINKDKTVIKHHYRQLRSSMTRVYELHNIRSLFLYEDKFIKLWQYIVKKGSLWKYLLSIITFNDNTITRGYNPKETRNNELHTKVNNVW